jgi:hypothetical protein
VRFHALVGTRWARALLAAATALFAAGAIAASASAAAVRVTKDDPTRGPALAGKRVVWLYEPRYYPNPRFPGWLLTGEMFVKAAVPGSHSHVLWHKKGGPRVGKLVASPDLVAFTTGAERGAQAIWVAPGRRRPRVVTTIGGGGDPCAPSLVDMDVHARVLAYAVTTCAETRILVRDYATGGSEQQVALAPPRIEAISLAGRFLAWHAHRLSFSDTPSKDEVVVYDRQAGAEAYRVDVTALAAEDQWGPPHVQATVQADGLVAVAAGPQSQPSKLAWYSPRDPRLHQFSGAFYGAPSVARNVIAAVRGADVVLLSLKGRTVKHLDRTSTVFAPGPIGWDGHLAAWTRRRVERGSIYATTLRRR